MPIPDKLHTWPHTDGYVGFGLLHDLGAKIQTNPAANFRLWYVFEL